MCGENAGKALYGIGEAGSSPRVRGKLLAEQLEAVAGRLIPACAGKTGSGSIPLKMYEAHPRVCGENDRCVSHSTAHVGSSPRVRGKRARGYAPP